MEIFFFFYLPNPQVNRLAYSAFPGNIGLFLDKHKVFMRYLLCWYIGSEVALPAKLHTELEGLRIPVWYPDEPPPRDDPVAARTVEAAI